MKTFKNHLAEAKRKGAPKMTGDSIAIQRAKDAEHAKAMGRSVKTGRKLPKKTMTSTQMALASLRKEDSSAAELAANANKVAIEKKNKAKDELLKSHGKVVDSKKPKRKLSRADSIRLARHNRLKKDRTAAISTHGSRR
jgi:hypothetical protein